MLGRVRRISLLVAVMFGAIHAWGGRFAMNADGISYLDIADAYVRGDWQAAVSSVWSPLYSWLLAVGLSVLSPTPYWEFPAVQLVNFAIFLGALASFDFFVRQLLRSRREQADRATFDTRVRLPEWTFLAAGYALFTWSSLNLIGVSLVTPHMTVAALLYLATGLLLRIRLQPEEWHSFVLLGTVLGLAYLARSPMLLLALIFLGLALLARPRDPRGRGLLLRVGVASAVFLVVAGVNAVPLFLIKGRLPFGDFAKLNYALWVNRYPTQHWQGEPPGSGTPRHPTRRLFAKPAVFEFAGPIGGTYPVWFDPSYWYEGVTPRFDLAGHAGVLLRSVQIESARDALSHWLPSVAICALTGYYARRKGWLSWGDVAPYGSLLVPSVAAFGMFAPVQLIDRYIGGFVPLIWLGVLSGVAVTAGPGAKRTAAGLALGVFALHVMMTVPGTLKDAYQAARDLVGGGRLASANVQWQVADGLRQMGLQPGGKVAVVGSGWNAYWARLARVQIVAEIPVRAAEDFWAADEQMKQLIMGSLARVGAEIVVASPRVLPRSGDTAGDLVAMGWRRVGATEYLSLTIRSRGRQK